jgi:DNA polymerase-3 subunit chi
LSAGQFCVTEFRFHHLEQLRAEQALPRLLERAWEGGRRIVVRAPSDEMVAALNDRLWTYDDASFLPHGAAGDGDPASHPIFLTTKAENPNRATMLVLLSGAETAAPEDDAFEEVIFLFDGRDEGAVAEARAS